MPPAIPARLNKNAWRKAGRGTNWLCRGHAPARRFRRAFTEVEKALKSSKSEAFLVRQSVQ